MFYKEKGNDKMICRNLNVQSESNIENGFPYSKDKLGRKVYCRSSTGLGWFNRKSCPLESPKEELESPKEDQIHTMRNEIRGVPKELEGEIVAQESQTPKSEFIHEPGLRRSSLFVSALAKNSVGVVNESISLFSIAPYIVSKNSAPLFL